MYNPPARMVPEWVQREIEREVREATEKQLRVDYGIDPKTQVLIIAVPTAHGWVEVRAFGNTYPHRDELRRRGFRWDGRRGMWAAWSNQVNIAGLDPRIFVKKEPVKESTIWKR